MKKYISLLLTLVCLLSLCACGGGKAEPTAAPVAEAPVIETPVETAAPAEEMPAETAAPVIETSLFDTARALEGESTDDLIAAIGEPVSREDYAPSCMGNGEDGLWHYNGFDVYTYRENDSESVYAVLEN